MCGLVKKTKNQYVHVLKDVGAKRGVYFLPAAEVRCSFVKQVTVPRWQQVSHEDDWRTDRYQYKELTRPSFVYVLGALEENRQGEKYLEFKI